MKKKSKSRLCVGSFRINLFNQLFLILSLLKASAAINGLVLTGLERNLCNPTAIIANSFKHGIVFLGLTASLTTLRLVHKALFSIELLLSGRKNEFLIAVLADESLVFVHFVNLA